MKEKSDFKGIALTAGRQFHATCLGSAFYARAHTEHFRMIAAAKLDPLQFCVRFLKFAQGQPIFGSLDPDSMLQPKALPRLAGQSGASGHRIIYAATEEANSESRRSPTVSLRGEL